MAASETTGRGKIGNVFRERARGRDDPCSTKDLRHRCWADHAVNVVGSAGPTGTMPVGFSALIE